MLIAGASREELLSLARKDGNGSVSALMAVFDSLDADEGIVWILRERCRGGAMYRVQFQVREEAGLKTVREAALVHSGDGWIVE